MLTINGAGSWKTYTNTLPAGAQPLGTIRRGFDTGALVKLANGVYVQVNAQVLRSLPQQAIMQAIARAG